jgi:hypothetical protein
MAHPWMTAESPISRRRLVAECFLFVFGLVAIVVLIGLAGPAPVGA